MVARDLSLGLQRRGHELRVVTAHYGDLPRREALEGVQVLRVPSLRRSPYQAGLGAMAGFVAAGEWAAFRCIRDWRPDLMHVHFAVPSGPVAWSLSRLMRIPYVLTVHLGDVPGGVPEKTGGWFRWVYPFTPPIWRDAARVVAVSEYTRRLALAHYPVDIRVIPNGVDLSAINPHPICAGSPPVVVFAGRFMPQKNPLQLVRTLAELKELPWRCVMLGDGPLRGEIEAAIRSAGLETRFHLPGWVQPPQVEQIFAQADILFMPSLSEGLPVVGVKALAHGLAIVASGVGGFVDLVEPGCNGFLIEPGETAGYRESLRELLAAPARLQEFRLAGRRKAAEFDLEHITDAYQALFEDVLVDRAQAAWIR
jgi:glycosyltransferase involved in cell wall biosynthesis